MKYVIGQVYYHKNLKMKVKILHVMRRRGYFNVIVLEDTTYCHAGYTFDAHYTNLEPLIKNKPEREEQHG